MHVVWGVLSALYSSYVSRIKKPMESMLLTFFILCIVGMGTGSLVFHIYGLMSQKNPIASVLHVAQAINFAGRCVAAGGREFFMYASQLWNSLSLIVWRKQSFIVFKTQLKSSSVYPVFYLSGWCWCVFLLLRMWRVTLKKYERRTGRTC